MGNYEEWLIKHNEILELGLELIKSFGFDCIIIRPKDKKSFIRLNLNGNKSDFHIKSIKNRYIKFVWLCKKGDFNPLDNYLVYLEEGETFKVCTGGEIDREGEYRESDYHKNEKYVVAPISIFRNAKTFFGALKRRYNSMLQRRMNEWT